MAQREGRYEVEYVGDKGSKLYFLFRTDLGTEDDPKTDPFETEVLDPKGGVVGTLRGRIEELIFTDVSTDEQKENKVTITEVTDTVQHYVILTIDKKNKTISATETDNPLQAGISSAEQASRWMEGATLGDISGLQDVLDQINEFIESIITELQAFLDLLAVIIAILELIIDILTILGEAIQGLLALLKATLQALKDVFMQWLNDLLSQGIYYLPLWQYFPWKKLMREQLLNPLATTVNGKPSLAALVPNESQDEPSKLRKVADPFFLGGTKVIRQNDPYSVKFNYNKFKNDIVDSVNETADRFRPTFSQATDTSGVIVALAADDIFLIMRLTIMVLVLFVGFFSPSAAQTVVNEMYEVFGEIPPKMRPGSAADLLPPLKKAGQDIFEWFEELWEWIKGGTNPLTLVAEDVNLTIQGVDADSTFDVFDPSAWVYENFFAQTSKGETEPVYTEKPLFGSLRKNFLNIELKAEAPENSKGIFVQKFVSGQQVYIFDQKKPESGVYVSEAPARTTISHALESCASLSKTSIGFLGPVTIIEDDEYLVEGSLAKRKVDMYPADYLGKSFSELPEDRKDPNYVFIETYGLEKDSIMWENPLAIAWYSDSTVWPPEWKQLGQCVIYRITAYGENEQVEKDTKHVVAFRYSLKDDSLDIDDAAYRWNDNFALNRNAQLTKDPSALSISAFESAITNSPGFNFAEGEDADNVFKNLLPIFVSNSDYSKDITTLSMPFTNTGITPYEALWDMELAVLTTYSGDEEYLTNRIFLNGQLLRPKTESTSSQLFFSDETFYLPQSIGDNDSGLNVLEYAVEYQNVVSPNPKPYYRTMTDGRKIRVYPYSADWYEEYNRIKREEGGEAADKFEAETTRPQEVVSLPIYSDVSEINFCLGNSAAPPIVTSVTKLAPSTNWDIGIQFMETQGGPPFLDFGDITKDGTNKAGVTRPSQRLPAGLFVLRGFKPASSAVLAIWEDDDKKKHTWIYTLSGQSFSTNDGGSLGKYIKLNAGTATKFIVYAIPNESESEETTGQINNIYTTYYETKAYENLPKTEHTVEVTGEPEDFFAKAPNWSSISLKSLFNVIDPMDKFLQSLIDSIPIPPNIFDPWIDWLEYMKERVEWLQDKIDEIIAFLRMIQSLLDIGGTGFYFLGINKAAGINGFLDRFNNVSPPEQLTGAKYVTGFVFLMPTDIGGNELMTEVFTNLPSGKLPDEEDGEKITWWTLESIVGDSLDDAASLREETKTEAALRIVKTDPTALGRATGLQFSEGTRGLAASLSETEDE